MMITFKGRVKRVEGVCHVSVSILPILPHAFTGIPNLRLTLVTKDLSFFWGHISFSPRSDQLSDDVIRISVVIILPTCSRPDCPDQ